MTAYKTIYDPSLTPTVTPTQSIICYRRVVLNAVESVNRLVSLKIWFGAKGSPHLERAVSWASRRWGLAASRGGS